MSRLRKLGAGHAWRAGVVVFLTQATQVPLMKQLPSRHPHISSVHCRHAVAPLYGMYSSYAMHGMHAPSADDAENVPGGHATQSAPSMEYRITEPAAHSWHSAHGFGL